MWHVSPSKRPPGMKNKRTFHAFRRPGYRENRKDAEAQISASSPHPSYQFPDTCEQFEGIYDLVKVRSWMNRILLSAVRRRGRFRMPLTMPCDREEGEREGHKAQ